MEIVGGLKVENELIKTEDPNETDVVEIRAEDIQNDIKQEPGENGELVQSEITGDSSQVISEDIHHEDLTDNQEYDDSSSDEEEGNTVQEELILNYKDHNLNDVKNNCHSPHKKSIHNQDNQLPSNERSNNSTEVTIKKSRNSRSNPMKILLSDYRRKNDLEEVTTYHCNHCKVVATSKRKIKQHIGQFHRDMALFHNKEERLQDMVNNTKSRYFAWYEYTTEDKKYRCSHCQTLHKTLKDVEYHILDNHRKLDQWKHCPHCPYKSLFDLTYHLSLHADGKDLEYFNCDKCDYKGKVKTHLKRHIEAMHRDPNEMLDKMYKCDQCNKLFKRHYVLQNHIKVIHHAGTLEKVKCFHCSFECRSRDSMKHHIETHHTKVEDLETLHCPQCSFKTKYKARLKSHVAVRHRGVLQCHICSYQCSTKTQMSLHLLAHKKEKNEEDLKYHCDRCDYKTYRAYSLQVHKLNHLKPEEIKYFYCYHCNFKAKRKDNLKSHIFRHFKQDEVQLSCYICEFTTQKRHILVKHMDKHSKEAAKVKKSKSAVTIRTIVPVKKLRLKTNTKNNEKLNDDLGIIK